MIELPEAIILAEQIKDIFIGKKIISVIANSSPHKFAWFTGDPSEYDYKLSGKVINDIKQVGGLVEVFIDDYSLLFGDGAKLTYIERGDKLPKKHQLLLEFEDCYLVASVQMYGGLWCYEDGTNDYIYYKYAKEKPSPLSNEFTFDYFKSLIEDDKVKRKSVKAFLATEQRIPGLGNGILQDILHNAGIHPKRKVNSLSKEEQLSIYNSIISTISEIVELGGRDTEKNLFSEYGRYKTKVSKNTVGAQCNECGDIIVKENYMGGSIYYCGCQKI